MAERKKILGSYGVDAPYVPILSALAAVVALVLGFVLSDQQWVWWLIALVFAAQTVIYMNATRRGKFQAWETILDDIPLQPEARVLDVGCGRGMVLIEAARRLTTGNATGIDLWRSHDQTGNDPAAAMANARENQVADKITLDTGDMANLPYADNSFDLVTANVSIQNIKDRELRRQTINEIVRVTRPGGQIRIVDIQYVGEYKEDMAAAQVQDLHTKGLGPQAWFGNPFFASKLVAGTVARN